ncbi:MAG: family 43 glycosylhydrolase [Ignavibacteria bacterium]|jgi:hypothetical protein
MKKVRLGLFVFSLLLGSNVVLAQNPLIMDQFTADPTARVFEGKVYVYPSHDVNCGTNWFCMKDYHVFSSDNLIDWTDHGIIITQEKVAWVDSTKNSMWAPDCYEKDGKYYFYFPAIADTNTGIKGMAIGVAVSDMPYGPFNPEPEPIKGVSGIDPNVFIDKDGQAYLYWAGMGGLFGAKLKENMMELAAEPRVIESVPEGMKEGPFLFERNGIYYFTFPHVIDTTEALVYGMGDDPLGPFDYKGIIMDEHPSGCWTNHHSILEYKSQWYLFYHHNDLSPEFDKNRSIRADSLFFNEDGTIQKVIPTLRSVGLSPATEKIQIDRYSALSQEGATIAFLDTAKKFLGWKTVLTEKDAWIKYNGVDFGDRDFQSIKIKALSETGSTIEIHIGKKNTFDAVKVEIPVSKNWEIVNVDIKNMPGGIQNITLFLRDSGSVGIDWLLFE